MVEGPARGQDGPADVVGRGRTDCLPKKQKDMRPAGWREVCATCVCRIGPARARKRGNWAVIAAEAVHGDGIHVNSPIDTSAVVQSARGISARFRRSA